MFFLVLTYGPEFLFYVKNILYLCYYAISAVPALSGEHIKHRRALKTMDLFLSHLSSSFLYSQKNNLKLWKKNNNMKSI